jgi:hypothetical protein
MTPPDELYEALVAERYGLPRTAAAGTTRPGGAPFARADDVIAAAAHGWSADQIAKLLQLPLDRVERILTHHRRTAKE